MPASKPSFAIGCDHDKLDTRPKFLQAESAAAVIERIEKQKQTKSQVAELSPAEAEKETGNKLFQKGKFAEVR